MGNTLSRDLLKRVSTSTSTRASKSNRPWLKRAILVLLAAFLSSCGGGDSDDGGDANTAVQPVLAVEFHKSSLEYVSGEAVAFEVTGLTEGISSIQVFIAGGEQVVHQADETDAGFALIAPAVADSRAVSLEILVNNQLISQTINVSPPEFGDQTATQLTEAAVTDVTGLVRNLQASLPPGPYADAAQEALNDLESLDLETLSEADFQMAASLISANFLPLLEALDAANAEAAKSTATCDAQRGRFLVAITGSAASVYATGVALHTLSVAPTPWSAVAAGVGIGAIVTFMSTASSFAEAIVEECITNLFTARLVNAFTTVQKLGVTAKSQAEIESLALVRLTERTLALQREQGVDQETLDQVLPAAAGIRRSLERALGGVRGKSEEEQNSGSNLFQGVINAVREFLFTLDSLEQTRFADRSPDEFNFSFSFDAAGVAVQTSRTENAVSFLADMPNALADQAGTLRVTDSADGAITEYPVMVEQRLPVGCPTFEVDSSACREAPAEYSVGLGQTLNGTLTGLFTHEFEVTDAPEAGSFSLNSETGEFVYTAPGGSEAPDSVTFRFVAVNGRGRSDSVTNRISILTALAVTSDSNFEVVAEETIAGRIETTRDATFSLVSDVNHAELELFDDGRFTFRASSPTGGYSDSFVVGISADGEYIEETVRFDVVGPTCTEYWNPRVLGEWTVDLVRPDESGCPSYFRVEEGGGGAYTADCDGDYGREYSISWQVHGTGAACYFHEEGFWGSGGFNGESRDALDSSLSFLTYGKFDGGEPSRRYTKR